MSVPEVTNEQPTQSLEHTESKDVLAEGTDVKVEGEASGESKEEVVKTDAVTEEKTTDDVAAGPEKKEEDPENQMSDVKRYNENGVLKTSARHNEFDRRKNNKFDASVLPDSDNPVEIRGQAEFYFSDSNLPTDDFLWEKVGGSENRPVSLEMVVGFKRMRRFKPYSAVVAALKESQLLEIGGKEGEETVKRKKPFDPATAKVSKPMVRSIYAKGFGDEKPSSQFDIEAFFSGFGTTNSVRLRRTNEGLFKGSVFVEFADEETCKKFLALDPAPKWDGSPLTVKSKQQYVEEKNDDIKAGRIQPNESSGRGRGRGRGRGANNTRGRSDRDGRGRGGRERNGDRDPDDWKKRRDDDRANGFKDRRGGGGRGNNKGGRGGRRDDRGPRNNDRNRERDQKNGSTETDNKESKTDADKSGETVVNEKKRAREDDHVEETPAKKVDTKATTEAS